MKREGKNCNHLLPQCIAVKIKNIKHQFSKEMMNKKIKQKRKETHISHSLILHPRSAQTPRSTGKTPI